MKRFSINDIELAVEIRGSGPPLFLAHGFPLDHSMWHHQIDRFASSHCVIAPDLRGFGKSQRVKQHIISMRQLADDCAALLDALAVKEPVVFCGLSMGGYIAWEFFQRHHSKLQSLILCDTRAVPDDAETARGRQVMAEHVTAQGLTALAESMLPRLVAASPNSDRTIADLRGKILDNDPKMIAAVMRGLATRIDARPLLAKIDVPTLLICGQQDVISPPAEMQLIAAQIPNAQFAAIASAGHMAPLEKPESVNRVIADFLQKPIVQT